MSVGHTCGYMDVQGIQYPCVPASVTPDTYIFVRVHLLTYVFKFQFVFTFRNALFSDSNDQCRGDCAENL